MRRLTMFLALGMAIGAFGQTYVMMPDSTNNRLVCSITKQGLS